jgi:hypothetical protein
VVADVVVEDALGRFGDHAHELAAVSGYEPPPELVCSNRGGAIFPSSICCESLVFSWSGPG